MEADAELARRRRSGCLRLVAQVERRAEIEARGIVVSARVLREAVRRDIEALFNTERFESLPLRTPQRRRCGPTIRRTSPTFPRCGAAWSTSACRPSPGAARATSTARRWRAS